MSPNPEQDERRTRRRVALLWLGSVAAVTALLVVGVFALTRDGGTRSPVDAAGTGTAPVLESPPVDIDKPDENSTTRATPGAGQTWVREQTRNAEDGGALVPTPRGTSGSAVLGPPRAHGVSLAMWSTLSRPLRPGVERTLHVSVRNPNPFPVDLFRIDVRVDEPAAAGCLAEWVQAGRYRYAGGTPRRIDAETTVVVNLPIELVNLEDVDQNACQSTAFPLRLSGVAVDTE